MWANVMSAVFILTSLNDGLKSVSLTPAGATRISSSSGPHLSDNIFFHALNTTYHIQS